MQLIHDTYKFSRYAYIRKFHFIRWNNDWNNDSYFIVILSLLFYFSLYSSQTFLSINESTFG